MASRITIKTGVLHAISAGATAVFGLYCSTAAWAQGSAPLQGWGSGAQTSAPAPWRVVGLPPGKAPLSSLEVVDLEGAPALRLRTAGSYGTLHHAMPAGTRVVPGQRLAWPDVAQFGFGHREVHVHPRNVIQRGDRGAGGDQRARADLADAEHSGERRAYHAIRQVGADLRDLRTRGIAGGALRIQRRTRHQLLRCQLRLSLVQLF